MEEETTLQNGGETVHDDIISEQKEEPDSKHEIAEEVEKCTTASAEASKKEKELSGNSSMRKAEVGPEGEHKIGDEGKTEATEDVSEEQIATEETTETVTEKKETTRIVRTGLRIVSARVLDARGNEEFVATIPASSTAQTTNSRSLAQPYHFSVPIQSNPPKPAGQPNANNTSVNDEDINSTNTNNASIYNTNINNVSINTTNINNHTLPSKSLSTFRQSTSVYETRTSKQQQVTTSELSHLEASVESSEPVQVVDDKPAPPPETLHEGAAPHLDSSEIQEKESNKASDVSVVKERSPEQNQDVQDQSRIEESEKVVEPSIKAQLNDIIKEIDEAVAGEDIATSEEEGQGQVIHTWRPKGKYDITPTPVIREEVVPINVADVPEPEPFVPQVPAGQNWADQHDGEGEALQEPVGPIIVPQLLPNGELGSPIEIPEGIPLLARILPKEEGTNREKIPLERLFTPATDSGEITLKKKKTFASSDFYAPNHPTIDDQLQLAQKISGSLVDQHNKTSKGQAMYERRKQRSAKWIHQEGGQAVQQQEFHEEEQAQGTDFLEEQLTPKSKPTMKLVMNPRGVQDHTTVEQRYQELLEQSHHVTSSSSSSVLSPSHLPASPEIVKDIMTDMQSPTGKGAALFAKRKKRMDKFIVDETNVQKTSAYQQQQGFVQNSSVEHKSVMNQFSSSFSSSSTGVQQHQAPGGPPSAPGSKKMWLKEKDQEQQRIMEEFMKNRESQYKLVKTPWEAVLETGNTSAAFQRTEQTKSSFSSSLSSLSSSAAVATPPWLEMPKPVPVTAPLPQAAPSAAPLPTPPSLFARPATEVINNGPLNNPTTLPDLTTILTSSLPAKPKSLTPKPSSSTANAANKTAAGLVIKPALNLESSISSGLLTKSNKSPRSSSVGNKPSDKRMPTIPSIAKYALPSYLNIASKPSGYLRSSSASSLSSLANAFAKDSANVNSADDMSDSFPFLKPGTPPILVIPGELENDMKLDKEESNIFVKNEHHIVKHEEQVVQENSNIVKTRSAAETSAIEPRNGTQNCIDRQTASASSKSPFDFKLCTVSQSHYDFVTSASAKEETNTKHPEQKAVQNDFLVLNSHSTQPDHFDAKVTAPAPLSYVAAVQPHPAVEHSDFFIDAFSDCEKDNFDPTHRHIFLDSKCGFNQDTEQNINNPEQRNKMNNNQCSQNSVLEPSNGHQKASNIDDDINSFVSCNQNATNTSSTNNVACQIDTNQINQNSFKLMQIENNQNLNADINSPICYAKLHDVKEHPLVTHFASTYVLSPKVDKKIHTFDFESGDTEVKIIFDRDTGNELVSDGEFDSFVSEIQRSFTASPVIFDSINVEDLKPPEFFRSVSRNDNNKSKKVESCTTEEEGIAIDADDPFVEHEIVTSSIFKKHASQQAYTVTKPKVINRDSDCPTNLTLKQQAVSNLEMLSSLSARNNSREELCSNGELTTDTSNGTSYSAPTQKVFNDSTVKSNVKITDFNDMTNSVNIQKSKDVITENSISSKTFQLSTRNLAEAVADETVESLSENLMNMASVSLVKCQEDNTDTEPCKLNLVNSQSVVEEKTKSVEHFKDEEDSKQDSHGLSIESTSNSQLLSNAADQNQTQIYTAFKSNVQTSNDFCEPLQSTEIFGSTDKLSEKQVVNTNIINGESDGSHCNNLLDAPDDKVVFGDAKDESKSKALSQLDELLPSVACNVKPTSGSEGSESEKENGTGGEQSVLTSSSKSDPSPTESVGLTGLMYTAEVKVLPPTVHPSTSNFQPRAAAATPTLYEPAPPLAYSGGMGGLTPSEQEQRRQSANFNLAATGWGTYNTYYRPTSFAS